SLLILARAKDTVSDGSEAVEIELLDGRCLEVRSTAIAAGYRSLGYMYLLRDITEQKNLANQLLKQANRDPLTGLYNRRFAAQMEKQWLREAASRDSPLAVVIIDLDHFKGLNDRYGHAAGDTTLRSFADLLATKLSPVEYGVRYGGEEFLIVLPGSDLMQAIARVDDWRNSWQRLVIRHGAAEMSCTFSAGVACYPQQAHSLEGLITAADDALYRAKREGRNRVRGTLHSGHDHRYGGRRRIA
ncbi:MAG TPA: GGDEF domain-containing protein, partial [Tianweitania sediminis]|nr:GGDEF domain-containing protein [Tianweitania sediminis]